MTQQARPLNGHHTRKPRNIQPPRVRANADLPSPEALAAAGAPDALVEDVRTWSDLITQEAEQARYAAAATAAAERASATYRAEVRRAMASLGDPSKVVDLTEKHKAEAALHLQFHTDAGDQRARLGVTLGPMFAEAAPTMFAAVEQTVEETADNVRGALAAIRATWADHSAAFQLRKWLSHAAFDGGTLANFHGSTALPRDVAAALDALDNAIAELDRLKADEAELVRWRAAEEAAQRSPAAGQAADRG